jgi:lactoylglutathione lyase
MFGLRTAIYTVNDIAAAKKWFAEAFQTQPYFDDPAIDASYIGFNIAGFELGLMPDQLLAADKTKTVLAYWGVEDIEAEVARLIGLGATPHTKPMNVGGPIMVASVIDPWGNAIGLIYNPDFKT